MPATPTIQARSKTFNRGRFATGSGVRNGFVLQPTLTFNRRVVFQPRINSVTIQTNEFDRNNDPNGQRGCCRPPDLDPAIFVEAVEGNLQPPPACVVPSLVVSIPFDGQTGVPTATQIAFLFDRNVTLVSGSLRRAPGCVPTGSELTFTSTVIGPGIILSPDVPLLGTTFYSVTVVVEADCGGQATVTICFQTA